MFPNPHRKRLFVLLLCALCLFPTLTSCFYYPDTNEEYDETFYDTYFVEDYNLCHLNLNDREGTIQLHSDSERSYYWDTLFVATIPETSGELFVAGIRRQEALLGSSLDELFIYQSKDAPIPRKDWTISEVKIFPGSLSSTVNLQTHAYKTHYRDKMDNAEILYSWQEAGADPALSEELHKALSFSYKKTSEGGCKEALYQQESGSNTHYILAITFQENPNLAWFAYVYFAQDGYYLGQFCYDTDDESSRKVERFYALGESWNLILEEMIHGMEQLETDESEVSP